MKRLVVAAVAVLMIFALVACSQPQPAATSLSGSASSSSGAVSVDESQEVIPVELPAGAVNLTMEMLGRQTADECAEVLAESVDAQEIVVNEDGSISVALTKQARDEALESQLAGLEAEIVTMTDGSATPSIRAVEYDEYLNTFSVYADGAAYRASETDGAVASLTLAMYGAYYQAFRRVATVLVAVEFVDVDTGENLGLIVYPRDIE